jgi:hypothetical protein
MLRGGEPSGVPGGPLDLARQACTLAYRLMQLKKPAGHGKEAGKEPVVVAEEAKGYTGEEDEEANEGKADSFQICAKTLFVSVDAFALCETPHHPRKSETPYHPPKSHKKQKRDNDDATPAQKDKTVVRGVPRERGGTIGKRLVAAAATRSQYNTK